MKRTTMIAAAVLTAGLMIPAPAFAVEATETTDTTLEQQVSLADTSLMNTMANTTMVNTMANDVTESVNSSEPTDDVVSAQSDADEKETAGWHSNDDAWYYINDEGERTTGWFKIDNTWYHFNDEGLMSEGWLLDGSWYWLGTSGAMHTGWNYVNGSWYWMGSTGKVHMGWQFVDGGWYYLGSTGAMAANWQYVDGSWYWLGSNGKLRMGWQRINGAWYYLDSTGRMLANTLTPDGYYVDANGVWDGREPGEREFVQEWTQRVDAYLAGTPMAGCGVYYAQAAWEYGVDPRVLPAISRVESGCGSVCWQAYNAWGWMAWLGDSWEESINNITRQFRSNYGSTITYAGAARYCESTDAWYAAVTGEMDLI